MKEDSSPLLYAEKDDFLQQVETHVKSLVANGPRAIKSVKHIVDATMDLPEKKALSMGKKQAALNIMSGQCIEGISAFLGKRVPKWVP